MGDHHIGRAMGHAATVFWQLQKGKPTQERALAALDVICKPYQGRDAEFEAEDPKNPGQIHPDYENYTDPKGPLGRLIAIAFNARKDEISLGDEHYCPWYDGPETRFRKRYGFC